MKKFIFMALLLCMMSMTEAQAKVSVTMKRDGTYRNDYVSFYFLERDGNQYLMAALESDACSFPEKAQILIRFFDDSVLTVDGECKAKDQTHDGGLFGAGDAFQSTAEFPIKVEDIERFKGGVQKIRVTTVPNMLENSYKKDKIGKKLYDEYKKSAF